MSTRKIKVLAISGSLRSTSSNNCIIKAMALWAPRNVDFIVYEGLGSIPPFDGNENAAAPVVELRRLLTEADGVLICTPEYAFGVPGVLKNALDWTVSSGELVNKPVALVTAATGGDKAHASLLLTLGALSAKVVEGATLLISFVRSKLNDKGAITDPVTKEALQSVFSMLLSELG